MRALEMGGQLDIQGEEGGQQKGKRVYPRVYTVEETHSQ